MIIGKVHHLGYLVKDIRKSLEVFGTLGYKKTTDIIFDEDRKSNFCFLRNENACVELVEPAFDSDIYPLLKKFNNAIYMFVMKWMI